MIIVIQDPTKKKQRKYHMFDMQLHYSCCLLLYRVLIRDWFNPKHVDKISWKSYVLTDGLLYSIKFY